MIYSKTEGRGFESFRPCQPLTPLVSPSPVFWLLDPPLRTLGDLSRLGDGRPARKHVRPSTWFAFVRLRTAWLPARPSKTDGRPTCGYDEPGPPHLSARSRSRPPAVRDLAAGVSTHGRVRVA